MGNSYQPALFGFEGSGAPLPEGALEFRALWAGWLSDARTRERYTALVADRGSERCAFWLGNVSSTGHGKLRVGSRRDGSRRMVSAHTFAFQLAHGVIDDRRDDVVVAHRCDEPSCQEISHLELTCRTENVRQFHQRRGTGPLADVRGARGRAVAVRAAILGARETGWDVEAAIAEAIAAGSPALGERLF